MERVYNDMLGRKLVITRPIRKMVSLVPSITEFLFDIGLEDEVKGVTRFCKYPEGTLSRIKVGGTKNVNLEAIDLIKPDLIIANKEENEKSAIDELEKKYPVFVSDVKTIEDAFEMMQLLGILTDRNAQVSDLVKEIKGSWSGFIPAGSIRVCYLIWKKPFMAAGGDTFINAMLEKAGFENIFKTKTRYPVTSLDDIMRLAPDVLLLSSEPYFFKEKDKYEIEQLYPGQAVKLVNGEIFSWYGSRMRFAAEYFQSLVNLQL